MRYFFIPFPGGQFAIAFVLPSSKMSLFFSNVGGYIEIDKNWNLVNNDWGGYICSSIAELRKRIDKHINR